MNPYQLYQSSDRWELNERNGKRRFELGRAMLSRASTTEKTARSSGSSFSQCCRPYLFDFDFEVLSLGSILLHIALSDKTSPSLS